MVDWLVAIVGGFLGALGVSTILDQILEKMGRPKVWVGAAQSRRQFFVLMVSAIAGCIGGVFLERQDLQNKERRKKLEDLEFKLQQLDGLMYSALGANDEGIPPQVTVDLQSYLRKYTVQIDELIDTGSRWIPQDDLDEVDRLWNSTMEKVEMIVERGIRSPESPALCFQVLDSSGDLKAIVRAAYIDYE